MNNKIYKRIQNSLTFGGLAVGLIFVAAAAYSKNYHSSIVLTIITFIGFIIFRLQDKKDVHMKHDASLGADE